VNAVVGDACPKCQDGVFEGHRGIEVGHIFKLGDKYSKALKATFQAADKSTKVIEMGTYGIGVTRTIAACVEQNFDADGIVWPESLAPFDVHLVQMGHGDSEVDALVKDIEQACKARGWDVLIDDRDLSAGVKFKDADLIGVPRRVTVGKKDLEQSRLQISHRKTKTKTDVPFELSNRQSSIAQLVQALSQL
jgi:prolyl-tRNA synthetase